MSQVETNAVALGKLFQSRFGGLTLDAQAPEELVEDMMRYAGSYELDHGFELSSSRLRRGGRERRRSFRTLRRAAPRRRESGTSCSRTSCSGPRGAVLPSPRVVPGRT